MWYRIQQIIQEKLKKFILFVIVFLQLCGCKESIVNENGNNKTFVISWHDTNKTIPLETFTKLSDDDSLYENGIYRRYYPNKKIYYEATYKNNLFEGKVIFYYDNGKVNSEYNYKKGKKDSLNYIFYSNGKPKIIENYKNGIKIGSWKYYSNDGILIKEEIYYHDSLITINSIKSDSSNKKNITIKYNRILFEEISISKIHLNSHIDSLIKRFGKPDSIRKWLNEFENTYFYQYYYGTSIFGPSFFTIENNLITGFEISHKQFIFDRDTIIVGDSCDKLMKLFPLSYENRYPKDYHIQRMKVLIGDDETFFLVFYIRYGKLADYHTWTSY